jgi:hypothetical protein
VEAEWLLTETIDDVLHSQHWMAVEHPRASVSHHSPDLLSQFRLVAVDGAFRARGLAFLEWALLEALLGIVAKSLAFRTWPV